MSRFTLRRERFLEIIGQIAQKQVLVIGDVGIDRYTIGEAYRLSPEAPVPVVIVQQQKDKLGLAANVADNVKALGAVPRLLTLVGQDRGRDELLQLMTENGISTDYVYSHPSRRTTQKERIIAQTQQIVRIDHETALPLNSEAESLFLGKGIPLVGKFDALILEDYAKGLLTESVARAIIDEAIKQKKFITVDPTTVVRSPAVYRGVSLFKPNQQEAERLSGIEIHDTDSLHKAGRKLQELVEAPIVVITQGKQGMTLFPQNEDPLQIPTFARSVYDVSGAGDTVISLLTLALVSGATLVEAALLANYAAGVEVGKQGTATVTTEELEQYMRLFGAIL
jgi:D-glycero-beta-D-manno-heptose-7-phosphate kinase